ncbi:hypothetical protein [Moritella viscosa]|uniref:Membrane protein oxaA n=1 Tax=Moritella viscosa TaxID=80854 RepID=A0ABY1HDP3_9GAMM|nr:hypothetical protein [Moritella viscosa]SGY91476.1 Membrane protein oxaA [Moritella viscosa]SGZ01435.1 Membrane protein oxaA [Moritella viscosa]SHO26258.1 Membrane protein oxaA [Moritella viscosa]
MKHATGGDMFEIKQSEIFYVYNKVKRDLPSAFTYNTDRNLIAKTEPLRAIVDATEDEAAFLLTAYAEMLVNNLTPEYIVSLRASLRSHRSRAKRQHTKEKPTSVTISAETQERINKLRTELGQDGKKLTQEQIIVMGLDKLGQ